MTRIRSPILGIERSPLGSIFQTLFDPNTPSTIADLSLWFNDTSITDAVSDNDPIGSKEDKSINGFDATQTTGVRKPVLKVGIQNGRNVDRYDGVDDILEVGNQSTLETDDFSVFVVAQRLTPLADAAFIVVQHFENVPISGYQFLINGGQLTITVAAAGETTKVLSSSGQSFPAGEWMILTAIKSGTTMTIYKNGTQIGTNSTFPSSVVYNPAQTSRETRLGRSVTRFPYSGDLAEKSVYARGVTDLERDTWWDYASIKWDIAL